MITTEISRGQMGIVYAAVNSATGQRVALKAVRAARTAQSASLRREIFALRRLNHPGVVRIVADGVTEVGPWYAMEMVAGEPLSAQVDRRQAAPSDLTPGALAEVLTLIVRLCETLAYVHGEGIVHGDLKPSNVLMQADRRPVLVDFGLASIFRHATGEAALDDPTWMAGTAEYMAPEQIIGAPIDARTDLYALGALFYELLTGCPPFVGARPAEVLRAHLTSRPPSLRTVAPALPASLDPLLQALLAKEPRDRLGHADDVIHELTALGAIGASRARRVVPILYRPPLTGREDLVARLLAVAERGASACGQIVVIGGESGIGKTHLVNEVARRCSSRLAVIAGGCRPLGGHEHRRTVTPLQPLRPFLQAVADRCAEQGAVATVQLLGGPQSPLAAYEPALARIAPAPPAAEGHTPGTRERLFVHLRHALASFAAQTPLLLLIDDLQWADELTLAFLRSLPPGWVTEYAIVLIATYRPEEADEELLALCNAPGVAQYRLDALDESAVCTVVADLLALPAAPRSLGRFLAEQSAGNPFFIAEFLRASLVRGDFRRIDHALRTPDGGEISLDLLRSLALPRTLHGLIDRRLDSLGAAARQLIEIAAVLGRESDPTLLHAASALNEAETMDGINELLRRQTLESLPSGRLRFLHDSVAEIAYARLDAMRRRDVHAAVATALEAATEGEPAAHAVLAHHWANAGRPERELPCRPAAAREAYASSAFADAARHWRRAVALAEPLLPRSEALPGQPVAEWEEGIARSEFGLGNVDQSEVHARRALVRLGHRLPAGAESWTPLILEQAARLVARRAGLTRRRAAQHPPTAATLAAARAAELLTHRYYYVDDTAALLGTSLLAVNIAEPGGAADEVPRAYIALAFLAGLLRQNRVAAGALDRARRGAEAKHDSSERAYGLASEAVYLATFGRFAAAAAPARAALRLLDDGIEAFVREIVVVTDGHVAYYTGRLQEAHDAYAEVERLARARGHIQTISWGLASRARCLHATGEFAAALPLIDETRDILARRPEPQSEVFLAGLRASTLLHLGQVDAALAMADETLARIRAAASMGFTSDEGYALALGVYLRLQADGAADQRLDARARELLRRLRGFARLIPAARPFGLLRSAEYAEVRGRRRRAAKQARRAHAVATRF
ncbi:MAG: AAA family ATPase, partial [bacterium]